MGLPYAEVIGDPVAHSKSPLIHRFWLKKLGLEGDYRATRLTAADLPNFFSARRQDPLWRGCNVTIPHKLAALRLADFARTEALECGAANCIVPKPDGLVAYNTDGYGADAGIKRPVGTACIIGCGGAARSAMRSLEVLANMNVRLVVRDTGKGRALLDAFGYPPEVSGFADAARIMRGADYVINATPLGMTGFPAMPAAVLTGLTETTGDAAVFDMVYSPVDTELLRAARALRRQTVDGLVMLVEQEGAAFRLFFKAEAPREHDAELRALLTA